MWLERNRDLKSLKKLDRKYIAMIINIDRGSVEFIFHALGEGFSEEYFYERAQAKSWVYSGDFDYSDPNLSTRDIINYSKEFPDDTHVTENFEEITKGRNHILERCVVYG